MRETIASVPTILESQTDLRRFLQELVDKIDEVLGFKGTTKYLTEGDLDEDLSSLRSIQEQVKLLKEAVEEAQQSLESLTDTIDGLTQAVEALSNVKATVDLSDDFKDLNYVGWEQEFGQLALTALGKDLVNSPYTVDPDASYLLLAHSVQHKATVYTELTYTLGEDILAKYMRLGRGSTWYHLAEQVAP